MGKCGARGSDSAAKTVKTTATVEPKKSRCGGGCKTSVEPKKKYTFLPDKSWQRK